MNNFDEYQHFTYSLPATQIGAGYQNEKKAQKVCSTRHGLLALYDMSANLLF